GYEQFLPHIQPIITPFNDRLSDKFASNNFFINSYKPMQMSIRSTKRRGYGFVIAIMMGWIGLVQAQSSVTVTGKIVFQDGTPASGVSVAVKGAGAITASDAEGNYQISTAGDGTLVFTLLGSTPQEIAINNRAVINV